MKERLLDILACPTCGGAFAASVSSRRGDEIAEGTLACPSGHAFPIRNSIPRLVESDAYVGSFSFEWHKFSKVQIDSLNGTTESEDTLTEKTGFTAESLRGKLVLDAGVGAGRFSEVASRWGAEVVGIDLSFAVDAAFENIGARPNVHLVQADIFRLPFRKDCFDAVFSIGVLHHTPNTKEAFRSLLPHLKPGGEVAIWVYGRYWESLQRPSFVLRKLFTAIPKRLAYYLCAAAVPLYYTGPLRSVLFPLLQFSPHRNWRWRWLDTLDWYTPHYVWRHTYPEVFSWFEEAGLKEIRPRETAVAMSGRK